MNNINTPTLSAKIKSFSWSYSKLKNYETCPRRYYEIDVKHSVEQPRSQELQRGDELHEAMRLRVQGTSRLPPQFIYMEKWAEKLTRDLHPYQIIQCELKLSIDRVGRPTGYMHPTTWLRGKIDYFRLMPSSVEGVDFGHVVDYKTGKPPRVWDDTQLMLNAHMIFSHYATCQKVRVDYLWTEYDDTTHDMFTREQIPERMEQLLPRVNALEEAHKTDNFPPTPNNFCFEYCQVTTCEFHGKRLKR